MKNENDRPDPDKLLSLIHHSQNRAKKGKLKIFLGMAAGVGKTYAMLSQAQRLRVQGEHVVVGWVDTHARKETEALVTDLALFPRKKISYKGATLEEMDIDGLLAQRPRLVVVDELAHTNAPGSRNTKRYLDVLELLDAGIDVFSALNIQHLESRVDTVREITGVQIFETVPDRMLDEANEIVLIDISPEELIKRLKEGRIYPSDRIDTAAANFFKLENLSALREMALRSAAEKVDRGIRDFKSLQGIEQTWKSADRLLVGVFASPYSDVLIRWTRRMANVFNATWVGVYVEEGRVLSSEEKNYLAKNIALVKELGGELISTKDTDVVRGILRVARQNNVTQILVGKSKRSILFQLLNRGSIVGRLIREGGDIDVSVVTSADERPKLKLASLLEPPKDLSMGWGVAVAIVLATWAVAGAVSSAIGYLALGIVFLVAVCLSALFLNRATVVFMAAIFAFIHNYFFIPPLYRVSISRVEDALMLCMYFAAALIIGTQTSRIAKRERLLREQENKTQLLLQLSKDLSVSTGSAEILERLLFHLKQGLQFSCFAYSLDDGKRVMHRASSVIPSDDAEGTVAWVMNNRREAGKGTGTLSASEFLFIPLQSKEMLFGVVGLRLASSLSIDTRTLVDAMLQQVNSSLERVHYQKESQRTVVFEQTQRLYHTLLDCVSHELRTPIASIKGSATALCDAETVKDSQVRFFLGAELLNGLKRLERVVENLLDMTRIESGMLRPKKQIYEVADILSHLLTEIDDSERVKSDLRISVDEKVPALTGDLVLTEQALAKVLNNAFQYTPKGTQVDFLIRNAKEDGFVEFVIRDSGRGLGDANPDLVFQKFYRSNPNVSGGLGLGLAIAKGFVTAQNGTIDACNVPHGGAQFTLSLPCVKEGL